LKRLISVLEIDSEDAQTSLDSGMIRPGGPVFLQQAA
jgi:hypothetical protein